MAAQITFRIGVRFAKRPERSPRYESMPGNRLRVVLLALVLTATPLRAFGMDTAHEVALGKGIERSIDAQSGTIADPFLAGWVERVFAPLRARVKRHDIEYHVKILDAETPNAFALPGGTIYVTKGMLNFVHSDDELAGVIGHEIGHVEQYHSVKMYEEVRGANTLLTIGKVFSPLVSRFGDLAEGLFLLKVNRYHELQADRYGLALMASAGYDPKAMQIFLLRLGAFFGEKHSALGKYFETHPGTRDRVAHLAGYPELDRVPPERIAALAEHDAEEGRYGFALARMNEALARDPSLHDAPERKRAYEEALGRSPLPPSDISAADDANIAAARAQIASDRDELQKRVKLGNDELRWAQYTLDSLEYDVALDSGGGIAGVADEMRLGRLLREQMTLGRNFDHAFNEALDTYAQAPPLVDDALSFVDGVIERRKAGNAAPSDVRSATLAASSARELLGAAAAARSTIASAYAQRAPVEQYTRSLGAIKHYPKGDLAQSDFDRLMPLLRTAQEASTTVFTAANAASDALNFAQARGTCAHIAALGVERAPAMWEAYRTLLRAQFRTEPPRAQAGSVSAADLAVATVVASATNRSADDVLAESRQRSLDLLDFARSLHLSGETVQLSLGIVWTAYTDPDDGSSIAHGAPKT